MTHRTRCQRTIAEPAHVKGIGFITGADIQLRFIPAEENTGIVFVRTDLPGAPHIPATVENVTGTSRRTIVGHPPVQAHLIEHVMAALAGLRIDNCYVELNGAEPPGMDGSAQAFAACLSKAGSVAQSAVRKMWQPDDVIPFADNSATLAIYPSERPGLHVSYFLDYGPDTSLCVQRFTAHVSPMSFLNEIAPARTFLLEAEAIELRKQGLGANTSERDLLVFGRAGVIGNQLRWADEPARHKVLDMIGDFALAGCDVHARVVGYRSGHELNNEAAQQIRAEIDGETGNYPRLAA